MLNKEDFNMEAHRIGDVYSDRDYDQDENYSDVNPVYLHRIQSIERVSIQGMRKLGLERRLAQFKILDYGCGNGRWLSRWVAWGASPENIMGADIREDALRLAQEVMPSSKFSMISEDGLDLQDSAFDVVYQNLVFSSILNENYRSFAAKEIARVLKPDGVMIWCDFTFDNPGNSDVRKVSKSELVKLFPEFDLIYSKKLILAPPIARSIVPISWVVADILECVPFLRTHFFAILRKVK